MATFKVMIKKGNKKADGTWNVVIRFTHKGITGKDSAQNFIPRVLVAVLRSLVKTNSTSDMRISDIVIVLQRILTHILRPRLLPLREIRLPQGGCGRERQN